jgi:type IV pilus assembly protein PilA
MIKFNLNNDNQKYSSAFTIVELLVVIVIIAILATITIVSYTGITKQAAASSVQSNLKQLTTTIDLDHSAKDTYPATSSAINSGKGFPQTSGISYSYNSLDNNTNYCASATNTAANITYHYTPKDGQIKSGDCGSLALSCPAGFIPVPGNSAFSTSDFCVMKYEAKNDGSGKAVSTAAGLPWTSIDQADAATASSAVCSGCHLITDNEWLTIAHDVLNVASNWSGGTVGSGYLYSGHNDNDPANALEASSDDSNGYYGTGNSSSDTTVTHGMVGESQRRALTLSNGEAIWDLAGNVMEWTSGIFSGTFPTTAHVWYTEWNSWVLVMNDLSSTFKPSYSEPDEVGNWGSAQGIGQLMPTAGYGSRGLLRGGYWGDTESTFAGVFSLSINNTPSDTDSAIGFRVSRG